MNGLMHYSIGDLAQRTGLTVKTIRFYADTGIVPPTHRTPAGYRQYDAEALVRLDLVRTLRELGVGLSAIRKVMEQELTLADVAATHAEALDVQIRVMRQRRAVLMAVARRHSTPQDLELMNKLANLSETERQALISDFLGAVFEDLDEHPEFAAVTRTLTPELPDEPEPDHIAAWLELGEQIQDPCFRGALRGMARDLATDRAPDDATGLPRILAEAVRAQVTPAIEEEVDPTSSAAGPIVTSLADHYARTLGSEAPDDLSALYRRLAGRRWGLCHRLRYGGCWPPTPSL
ncbi:MerR family transcriptional regulator [Streptomyces sp. NPDC047123]|uniref:MerR family transcriptional regulator n=1 Tax=Streptomyces sp. NPDC047123 TaxID=3155622 RepID=UPI0033D1B6CE